MVSFKFQPRIIPAAPNDINFIDLLPANLRTRENKKLFDSTVQQLFAQEQSETQAGYIGRKPGTYYDYQTDFYISEQTADRTNYQLEPTLVSEDSSGNVYTSLFYNDLVNQLGYQGALTNNHSRLFGQEYYSFSPNIDLDKFVNYNNYYWIEFGPPALVQELVFTNEQINVPNSSINVPNYGYKTGLIVKFVGTNSNPVGLITNDLYILVGIDQDNFSLSTLDGTPIQLSSDGSGSFTLYPQTAAMSDYPGKVYANLPNGTPLQNGMRIVFMNDAADSVNGKIYLVEGVGSSIVLLDDSYYDTQGEYDVNPYDTVPYDYANPTGGDPDYITIQRASSDGNQWSRRNRWFHADLISNANDNNLVMTQAVRPIIEFIRGLQLYNFGNKARQDVDLVYDLGNVQSITGLSSLKLDDTVVHDNYRILVINDIDPERNNRIFKVYGLDNAGAISLSLEPDGEDSLGNPVLNETVYVASGISFGGKVFYFNGFDWIEGQQKTEFNQAPLFQLYDETGISLADPVEYPESNFTGSTLFEYAIDSSFVADPVLGLQVVTDILGKPSFNNSIESQTYTYISNYLDNNISGYYFALLNGNYVNHWHKSPTDSKQYIVDNFVVGPAILEAPVVITAATSQIIPNFVKGSGPQGIGDQFVDVDLQSGLIDSVTVFQVGNLILVKDQTNGSQNGIYEYISGSLDSAILARPPAYEKSSQIQYGFTVTPTLGTNNANNNFVMLQTLPLDWNTVPMFWENVAANYGLQTTYTLSQTPDSISDFDVVGVSQVNISGFTKSSGSDGIGDTISDVNLVVQFGSIQSFNIGDIFLVMAQTAAYQNGIYQFTSGETTTAILTRYTLADQSSEIKNGTLVLCIEGPNINQLFEMQQAANLDWTSVSMIWTRIPKPTDNISVQYNGLDLIINQDFNLIDGNILNLSSTLSMAADDFIQVRTYSVGNPNTGYTGYYEIPLNLEANAVNDYVTTVPYVNLVSHFSTIIENQNDFTGSALGDNNYSNLVQNLGLGTNILQHSAPMLKLMTCDSLRDIDISVAMNYAENEYVRFYNKFFNKIQQLQTQGYTDTTPFATWVNAALSAINIGKNSTFSFAHNQVGGGTFYIPPSPAFLGITPVYRPQKFIDTTANTPLRVLRLHDGQLIPSYDNPIATPNTNSVQQIIYASDQSVYELDFNDGVIYSWQLIVSTNGAPLIPEIDYTIQTGIENPSITFTSIFPTGTSITVEWSNNIIDNVILYLENLIYTSINTVIRQDNSFNDNYVNFSHLEVKPGFFRDSEYTVAEWNKVAALDFNNWVASNQIALDINSIFDESNPFTWNYSSVLDPNGNYLPGYWRGIFLYFYDTDRPHTHPWEILGFSEKPLWWINTYGPPPYTAQNTSLWNDISTGTIKSGARQGIYDYLARPNIFDYLPVDDQGNLLDPVTIGLATTIPVMPFTASVTQEYMQFANAPFVFGDMGPIEYGWKTSPNYSFGLAETMYLTKPARFVEYFWDTNTFAKIYRNQSDGEQFVDRLNGLNRRLPTSQYTIYGENNTYTNIGIQQWLVEYLIFNGNTADFLGDRIRGANAKLAYRASGFIDSSSLQAVVDSFGIDQSTGIGKATTATTLIPSDNITTTLHTSSSLAEASYSGLFIKKKDDYYEITGYDFVRQYFQYYAPVVTSSAISVNVGGTQPTINAWASNAYYTIGTYVSFSGSIYICTTNNTAGVNFSADLTSGKWSLVNKIPLVGGVTVQKYAKYDTSQAIQVPYNTRFTNIQDMANFVYGYEQYLEASGWIFDAPTDNGSGAILNFSYMFNQVLTWITSNSTEDFIIISPFAASAKFNTQFGYVDNLQNKVAGFAPVIDRLGYAISLDKVSVSRVGEEFSIQTVASNSSQSIYGLKLSVVAVEHIVIFSNVTNFDDLIYSPLYNLRQERIRLFFTRSANWNGKFSAPGFIIGDTTITANFDKSVNDISKLYDPNSQLTSDVSLAAKKLFGFQVDSSLTDLLLDDRDQFQLYLGFLRTKGTQLAFTDILRSAYLTDPTDDITFFEEWAVRIGRYGSVTAESDIEIELRQQDVLRNPQIVNFSDSNIQNIESDSIQIGPSDPRYLVKRFNNTTIDQFETKYLTPKVPTAGYALVSDAVLLVPTYAQLETYINDYLASSTFSNADRIWVAIGKNGKDWKMLRLDLISDITSIALGAGSTDPAIVTLAAGQPLLESSLVILQNVDASNSGIYEARNVSGNTFDVYDLNGNAVTSLTAETFTNSPSGLISTGTVQNAGTGFVSGTFTNVALLGGSGTGATANITTYNGSVTSFVISNQGVNYQPYDVLTFNSLILAGATAATGVSLTAEGTNYGASLTYNITTTAFTGGGTGLVVNVNTSGLGAVTSINAIINGGTGFAVGNTVGANAVPGHSSSTGFTATVTEIGGIGTGFEYMVYSTVENAPIAQAFRLHNCRYNTLPASIKGTVQNPVISTNTTLSINGTAVSLLANDNLQSVITKINNAAVPHVTAKNWFGMLQLTNSQTYGITLSPRCNDDLGIESTTPISGWDSVNDLLYFDTYPTATGYWSVTHSDGSTIVRQQPQQIDINYVKSVSLIDQYTDVKLLDLNFYNPLQNVFPRAVTEELDFISDTDPAQYNAGSNANVLDAAQAWTNEKAGIVWWDQSQIRYLNYDQQDVTYRSNYWGAVFPGTNALINEWVKSPVMPNLWSTYVTSGDGYGVYSTTSTPTYMDRYVVTQEYNPLMGEIANYYYFWINGNYFVPQVPFRNTAAADIQGIIQNPTNQGVVWFSPITTDNFLVANAEPLLDDATILQIGFNDYYNKNRLHKHWRLLREYESLKIPPQDIWQKMQDSLVTFVKLNGTQDYLSQNGIGSETFNTMLANGSIILESNLVSPTIYSAYLAVPDPILSQRQAYGTLFRPRQSWFQDPFQARQVFVEVANDLMNKTNWVDTSPTWNLTISTEAQLFGEPDFTVNTLADRDALLNLNTTGLFNGCTVYVVSDVTRNGNWSLWEYDGNTVEKFIFLKQQTFNAKDYWSTVDWYSVGYDTTIINDPNILVFANITDRDAYNNFTVGQLIRVTNSGDGNWVAFTYSIQNNIPIWTVVAKQNGTVNFNSNLYDFTGISASNLAVAQQAASESMYYIVSGFYNDLSSTVDKNNTVVALIREAYAQNQKVDWAFKTSLISTSGIVEELSQRAIYKADLSASYDDYLTKAKPFRTKLAGLVEKTIVSIDPADVQVSDTYSANIIMKIDAVSLYPNQQLVASLLALPDATVAQKEYKQQQISQYFTAAERISVFSNQDPGEMLPGAKYRGIDIDGAGFTNFSAMFGIKQGYDNSPFDNILGYDFDNNDMVNLYDAFINGQDFTSPDQTNASDIVFDADKFIQPYLEGGRPDQLVNLRVADTLNLSVYTQGLIDNSNQGYDVFPYDQDGPSGNSGYDYILPNINLTDGRPEIISQYATGDASTKVFQLQQMPQSSQAVQVFVNGQLKLPNTDYIVNWSLLNPNPNVVFSTIPNVGDAIKITTYSVGGASRIKTQTFMNSSATVYDMEIPLTSAYGIFVTVNGSMATYTTNVSGNSSLSQSQVQITSSVPANSTVVIIVFAGTQYSTVYRQTYTYASSPTLITEASQPVQPAFANNLVYMSGKRLNPPYTRYYDITGPGITAFSVTEQLIDTNYVEVYIDGTMIPSSDYSINYLTNQVVLNTAPGVDSTVLIAAYGNEDFRFNDTTTAGLYNELSINTTAKSPNSVVSVVTGQTLTVNGTVITFGRPDSLATIPVDKHGSVGFVITGTTALSTSTSLSITGTLTVNSVSVTVAPTDTLTMIMNNINTQVNSIGVTASIQSTGGGNGYLVLANSVGYYGFPITISGFSAFGMTDGSYHNAAAQIRSALGTNYSATTINGKLVIKSLQGLPLAITDTIFGFSTTYTNVGNAIKVYSYNVNNTMDMRTEVYQGNTSGQYPITSGNEDSNSVFLDIDGLQQSYLNSYNFASVRTGWSDAGYNIPYMIDQNLVTFTGVQVTTGQTADDTVIVTSFNSRATGPTLGMRMFKNVNEQWQYLRISDSNSSELVQVLRPYDTQIIVKDATVFTQPNVAARIPGVVFVGAERIYFWNTDTTTPGANKLQQLLRGTSGTPWGVTYYPSAPQTVSFSLSTNEFTFNDHGLRPGQNIMFQDNGGTLPVPLTQGTVYYVIVIDRNTFKIATSYQNTSAATVIPITITTAGSGTIQMVVNGSPVVDAGQDQSIPVDSIRWFFTPNGLVLSDNALSDFLKDSSGSDKFTGG